MASFISVFDIFGTGFQFTTFKHDKFKTTLGGIMTSICVLTITLFTYFFGKNFLFRENPTILQQQVFPENYSDPFILNQENMPIIWRLDDNYVRPVNFTGIFYPKLTHYTYVNNATGSILIKQTDLPVTQCSPDLVNSPGLLNNLNLEEWYCFDWRNKNLTFGGGWDGSYTDYFVIELWLCAENTFSTEDCTDINDVSNLLNVYGGIYFDLYYPEFYFVPSDTENPTRIQYLNYYFRLNLEMRRLDRLYFSNYTLMDDIGWIIRDQQPKSLLASNDLKSDYMYYADQNYGIPGQDSTFYALNIYFTKQSTLINRSYMKIQELLAVVGGFSEIILFAGLFLSKFFNIYIRDELLYNELFEYSPMKKEHDSSKLVNLKDSRVHFRSKLSDRIFDKDISQIRIFSNPINKGSENVLPDTPKFKPSTIKIFDKNKIKTEIKTYTENLSDNSQKSNKMPIQNITKDRKSTVVFKNLKTSNSNNEPGLQKQGTKTMKKRNNTIHFGWCFTFCNFLCRVKRKDNLYVFLKRYINERLDVAFYLKTLEKFDRVRVLLFNYYQNMCLDFTKIPNLSNQDELTNIDMDLQNKNISYEELADYFNFRIRNREMDECDEQLLKMVTPEIQNLVISRNE